MHRPGDLGRQEDRLAAPAVPPPDGQGSQNPDTEPGKHPYDRLARFNAIDGADYRPEEQEDSASGR